VQLLLRGSGQCAEVHWRFLGLSIAEWSFAWFAFFALYALWLMARKSGYGLASSRASSALR
jgi:disulfide bond formation protein DsbB